MVRRLSGTIVGLLVFSAVSGLAATNNQTWIRGCYVGNSPKPAVVGETEAWQQATALADITPEAFVLVGSGHSMNPLYAAGTILVLRKASLAELRCGQTVLYRNHQQRIVAHLLVAQVRDGWRAQGLNNASQDMEPVNGDNLVGVVVAAFKPSSPARVLSLASLR